MNKKDKKRLGKKFMRPEKAKYQVKALGPRAPNWNNMDLAPFEKNFYREHPDVKNRLRQDVERFRNKHEISVQGLALNPIESFDEVFMPDYVAREIRNQGYSRPTPIQSQTWPIAFSGYNLVGIAQTGSGKTLAYILPAIIHINSQPNVKPGEGPIAVVLAPTRELAAQIQQVAIDFGSSTHIRTACTVGGVEKKPQEMALKRGCEILIATPGRLIDFLSSNVTNMNRCTYLVLDEADRMLDMGFEAQIREIITLIRPDKQILMWSATWPREIRRLAEDFLSDYIQVNIGSMELSANHNIKQFVHICRENEKSTKLQLLLRQIYTSNNPGKILIFVAKKKRADMISKYINNFGVACESLHGDKAQVQRTKILDDFRSGRSNIIVATDVAARGLDVDGIMYVINLDFPRLIEDYVHRIGRCGRCDRMGISYAFFTRKDYKLASELIAILNEANQPIDAKLLEICNNPVKPEKIDKKQRRLNENSGFQVPIPEKRRHDGRHVTFNEGNLSNSGSRAQLGERDGRHGTFSEGGPSGSNVGASFSGEHDRRNTNFNERGPSGRAVNLEERGGRNVNFNELGPINSSARRPQLGEHGGRNLNFDEPALINSSARRVQLGERDGPSSARGAQLGERDGPYLKFNETVPSSLSARGAQLGERDGPYLNLKETSPSSSGVRGTYLGESDVLNGNSREPDFKRPRMIQPMNEPIDRNNLFDRTAVGDFRNELNIDRDYMDNDMRRLDDRSGVRFQTNDRNFDGDFMENQSRPLQAERNFGRTRDRMDDNIDRELLFEERARQQQRPFDRMDDFRMASARCDDFDAPQRFAPSSNFKKDDDLIGLIGLDRVRNTSGTNFGRRESDLNRLNDLLGETNDRMTRDYFEAGGDSRLRNTLDDDIDQLKPFFKSVVSDRRNYERELDERDQRDNYSIPSRNFEDALQNRSFDSLHDRSEELYRHMSPNRNNDRMPGGSRFSADRFPNQSREQDSPLRSFGNRGTKFSEPLQNNRFDIDDMRIIDEIIEPPSSRWNKSTARDAYPQGQNRRDFGNDSDMRRRNDFGLDMDREMNLNFSANSSDFDVDFRNRNKRDFGGRNVDGRFGRFN